MWSRALETLPPDEKGRLKTFVNVDADGPEVLSDILQAAQQKKVEAQEKRWRFTWHGHTYIVRDYLEKIIAWVERFKAVGDTAVQYDPTHAALPWACVRFFLQAAVDNVRAFGIMAENMSQVVNLIAQSAIVEDLYLGRNLKIARLLEQSLTRLYARILRFLDRSANYYSNGTVKNLAKSALGDLEATKSISDLVAVEQDEIERCMGIAEAEIRELDAAESEQAQSQYTTDMKKILSALKSPICRIAADTSQLLKLSQETDRQTILRSLSTLPYPSHHQAAVRGRLDGSGEWLLHHQAFRSWRGSSSSTILWLHGIPGCGKTKLCSVVIDSIKAIKAESAELLAFFYCARDPREPLRGQCKAAVQSLLRQAVAMSPNRTVPKAVKTMYEKIQDEGFEEREWSLKECKDTLIHVMDIYPSLTIVIDALDECDEDERMDLLVSLKEVRDKSANLVKILISSRDDVDIISSLADTSDIRVSAAHNSVDINRFVDERVSALMDSRENLYGPGLPGLRQDVASVLSEKAEGMFRWVDLQLDTLKRAKLDQDLKSRLGRLPRTLDNSYYAIYCAIQDSGTFAKLLANGVFQWLLYGQQAIETETFAAFISLVTGASVIPLKPQHLLDICGNLVEIDPALNVFRFVHLSVREFFEHFQGRGDETFTPSKGHAALAHHSLLHICSSLAPTRIAANQELLGKGISSYPISEISVKKYVDRYWHEHARLSGENRYKVPFQPLFDTFIRPHPDSSIFEIWCRTAAFDGVTGLELERCYSATRSPAHPVWLACAFDLEKAIDFCNCQGGFDTEMRTGVSLTPLLEAARLGSPSTLRKLVECGADVWAVTANYRKGVADFALENGHTSVIEQLEELGLMKLFASVKANDGMGSSGPRKLAKDEAAIEERPSVHVDFLAHEWKDEEFRASRRYLASHGSEYGNKARLENAAWRAWTKAKDGLKTVSPEKLNWLKDCDVTWLYGPMITGSNTSPNGSKSTESRSFNENDFTIPLRGREIKHVHFNEQVMQAISVGLREEDVDVYVDSPDNGNHEDPNE
ncbi:hypothetical protein CABS01_10510 [Colletotrichum abscissum]|uniref:uncharacterized protein n=1 Tax=Colletotrichum abscissum TaxID=1671311 RepID=UPI0027D70EA7|nr:uncharacterized protein CABS01_10510 [Colletotrichum abscissum]KAK1498735.1 hypothetical protein CABS01_10510 [Colletotrichum abscissum]